MLINFFQCHINILSLEIDGLLKGKKPSFIGKKMCFVSICISYTSQCIYWLWACLYACVLLFKVVERSGKSSDSNLTRFKFEPLII